jgi:hypothetical protein
LQFLSNSRASFVHGESLTAYSQSYVYLHFHMLPGPFQLSARVPRVNIAPVFRMTQGAIQLPFAIRQAKQCLNGNGRSI